MGGGLEPPPHYSYHIIYVLIKSKTTHNDLSKNLILSGRPRSCYSYWPYAKPGLYNNAYYSYCGVPGAQTAVNNPNVTPNADYVFSPRGSVGETPWTATFNANVSYTPNWLDGLTLSMDVLNLLNKQTATGYYERSASSRTTGSRSPSMAPGRSGRATWKSSKLKKNM